MPTWLFPLVTGLIFQLGAIILLGMSYGIYTGKI